MRPSSSATYNEILLLNNTLMILHIGLSGFVCENLLKKKQTVDNLI